MPADELASEELIEVGASARLAAVSVLRTRWMHVCSDSVPKTCVELKVPAPTASTPTRHLQAWTRSSLVDRGRVGRQVVDTRSARGEQLAELP